MKKHLFIIMMFVFTVGLVAQSVVTPQGSGTETDPYQVTSYENLNWLTSRAEDAQVPFLDRLSAHYIQTQDIEFPAEISEWDNNQGFLPIGYGTLSESFPFSGYYDGQGHTISNLYMNRPSEDGVSFFGLLITGTVMNLGLVDVEITGAWGVAGIVSEMDTNSLVENSFVTGDITGEAFVGGITGYNFESEINNCYFIGSVDALEGLAGIAGFNDTAYISNCYAVASVTDTDYAGVITGLSDGGGVSNSFWDTDIANGILGIGEISESEIVNTVGKTTEEMKSQATFTDAGWDFTSLWQINENINASYPSFQWQESSNITDPTLPPMNLTADVNASDVVLNWEEPLDLSEGAWITKAAEENNDGIGVNGPAEFGVAHKYTQEELLVYQGLNISSIKFFPREATATYTVSVWGGESGQDLLYSQEASDFVNEAWNEHQLTSPVAIPASGPLYIGYMVDTQVGFPAGCDAGPAVQGGDQIHFVGEAWDALSAVATPNINWNIQAFVSPEGGDRATTYPLVKANKAVKNINSTTNFLAGNLNPIITNRVRLDRDVSAYKIYRNNTEIAEVGSDILTYTDSNLDNATYTYHVTAMYGDSESASSNTVVVTVNVLNPDEIIISDSFEDYADFSMQFGDWTLVDGDLAPTYGFSGTTFPNAESMFAYIVFNPALTTPPLEDTGYQAPDGDKYLASFAATTPPNNDWLISPAFTIGTSGSVSFLAKSITNQYGLEKFNVLVSTGSTNPNDFNSISGNNPIEAPIAWTPYTYDLTQFAANTIRIAIQCVSNDAFVFMLDNIVITSNGMDNEENTIPALSTSLSNYPNPFNPQTTINYSIQKAGKVSLDVYNLAGQKVKTLVNDRKTAGSHNVVWNGKDDAGNNVSSGVYFYRITNGNESKTNKMILMK